METPKNASNASRKQNITLTTPNRLVDASQLLEILFEENSRPCVRWLREQTRARSIPYLKIGRLIFFDPVNVKAHLDAKAQKEAA